MSDVKYFKCNCGGHLVSVEVDEEFQLAFMSFWELGQGNIICWKHRLKHIWNIIKTGTPYSDSVVFDVNEWKKFQTWVISQSFKDKHYE